MKPGELLRWCKEGWALHYDGGAPLFSFWLWFYIFLCENGILLRSSKGTELAKLYLMLYGNQHLWIYGG